jgi:hypothetical protein
MTWWLGRQISTFPLDTVLWADQPCLFKAELNFSRECKYGGREYLRSAGFVLQIDVVGCLRKSYDRESLYTFPYLPDPSVFR